MRYECRYQAQRVAVVTVLGCVENPSTGMRAQQLEKAGSNGIVRPSQPGPVNFI
jgi:hypothetical protein